MTSRAAVLACLGLLVAVGTGVAGAQDVKLACSPERPLAEVGSTVGLRAWAGPGEGGGTRYAWTATDGRLVGEGARARWTLVDMRPGRYAAAVRATSAAGLDEECVVRVVVTAQAPQPRDGIAPPMPRESGSALLLPGQVETPGYGLYSYLLIGAVPGEAGRARALEALDAYWRLLPAMRGLEQYVRRAELNAVHLPLTEAPGTAPTPAALLERYDHARARSLLRRIDGLHRDGPYLVSVLRPLGEDVPRAQGARYLVQDLSAVPVHLVREWVKEFLNQAAQERFWEPRALPRFAQKLRLTIGVLSLGLPEVQKALDTWISWTQ
jgi:hypothetical protein